jgi:hypothetical protein
LRFAPLRCGVPHVRLAPRRSRALALAFSGRHSELGKVSPLQIALPIVSLWERLSSRDTPWSWPSQAVISIQPAVLPCTPSPDRTLETFPVGAAFQPRYALALGFSGRHFNSTRCAPVHPASGSHPRNFPCGSGFPAAIFLLPPEKTIAAGTPLPQDKGLHGNLGGPDGGPAPGEGMRPRASEKIAAGKPLPQY